MSLTMHEKKKNLYWGVAILMTVVLASLAWAQIASALQQCLWHF